MQHEIEGVIASPFHLQISYHLLFLHAR